VINGVLMVRTGNMYGGRQKRYHNTINH